MKGPRHPEYRLVLSPDGKYLALTDIGGGVALDDDTGEDIRVWEVDSGAFAVLAKGGRGHSQCRGVQPRWPRYRHRLERRQSACLGFACGQLQNRASRWT